MNLPRILAVIASSVLVLNATAQDTSPNNYQEPGFNPGRDYVNQHFTENIDPFTGNLTLNYVDIFVPGNGGFDIKVRRTYNLINAVSGWYDSPFGAGWDIHFGRVHHRQDQGTCGYSTSSPNTLILELPDGSQQTFYKANGGLPGTSAASDYLTVRMWKARCDNASGGMIVTAPDGTRYDMTTADLLRSSWLVSRITDRNGNQATFQYVAFPDVGLFPQSVSALGASPLITFNYTGSLLSSITSQGRNWQYTVTRSAGINSLQRVQPPAGGAWQYTYYGNVGAQGLNYIVRTVTYPTGGSISYNYSTVQFFVGTLGLDPNTVVSSKASGSSTWTYNYSPSGGPGSPDTTTVTQPGNLGTITYKHFGYNTVSAGNVWMVGLLQDKTLGSQSEHYDWTSMTVSGQPVVRQGYNKIDNSVQRPLMSSRTIVRDGVSYTTNYSGFDTYGNPQSIAENGNRARTRSINYTNLATPWILGLAQTESVSGGGGSTTRSWNTSNGNLDSETRYGVTTGYGYNSDGSMRSRTNARSNTTSFDSYFRGVPQTENRPEGVAITRVVDNFGNVTQESNGEATWNYGYDNLNRLTSVGYPAGASATISWGSAPPKRTFTRGSYVDETDFDGFGRVRSRERGNILIQYDYDALGRKVFESFPDSAGGTTFTLDTLGRVTATSSPHGTTQRTYPFYGTRIVNERGFSTTYTYERYGDPDGGAIKNIDAPAGTAVSMTRDTLGNLETATQGGVTRTYRYDSHFFLTSIIEPETGVGGGGTTTFGRDAVGNLKSKSATGSGTIVYDYDNLDRLKAITYPNAPGQTVFTYFKRGLVKTVTNPNPSGGSIVRTFDYDGNGNLRSDSLALDSRTFLTTYDYDTTDGLSTVAYPTQMGASQRTVNFLPDLLGRPRQASPFVTGISYRPSGNLATMNFANGVSTTFSEDFSRLIPNGVTTTGGNANFGITYGYDGVGNVSNISGDESISFSYDGADRLVTANGPWGSGQITYSDAGNILSKIFGAHTVTLNYTSGNRITSASIDGHAALGYSYDAWGNTTTNGRDTFVFDDASNVTCVDCGTDHEIRYAYDGKGWRVSQQKNGRKTYFQHAPNGDLMFEFSPGVTSASDQWKQHVYIAGKRVATRSNDLIATTTSIAANNDASGNALSLTATVAPAGATGTVTFRAPEGTTGIATLVNGAATWSTVAAQEGSQFQYTAAYSGDVSYLASSSTAIAVNIHKRLPSVSIVIQPDQPAVGQSYSVSGTVSGDSGFATGTVELSIDGGTPATTTISSAQYTFANLSGLAAGTHTLTAHYLGDAVYKEKSATLSRSVGPPNPPPTVAITSPASGATVTVGQSTTITATATDDGSVNSVTFMDGATSIGTAAGPGSTFSAAWIPQQLGSHSLTARAVDNLGASATSSAVVVTAVCASTDQAPSVTITSPANGTTLSGPTTISFTVAASDPENALDRVEFYSGGQLIGQSSTAPYSFAWSNVGGGTFSVTAKAFDTCGHNATSAPVTFTVNAPIGFVNGGFESPVVAWVQFDIPPSSGWTGPAGQIGLYPSQYMTQPTPPRPEAVPPEGNQAAIFATNAYIQQSVWLAPGNWQISFRAFLNPNATPATVRVLRDGVQFYEAPVAIGSWSSHLTPVIQIASAGQYLFQFAGGTPAQINNIFIDDIRLTPPVPVKSAITSPAPGSRFASSTVTLIWDAGVGITQRYLEVGTTLGGADIYAAYQYSAGSQTVSGLPTNGGPIFVRLRSWIDGAWQWNDYSYIAAGGPPARSSITAPTASSVFSSTTVQFSWDSGVGVTQRYLQVGTTPGGSEIYAAYQYDALSQAVTGLPRNGTPIYVRLMSWINGGWQINDYSYTAVSGPASVITDPAQNSELTSPVTTFSWDAGTSVTQRYLAIGTAQGGTDIYAAYQYDAMSATISGLPANGSPIYVRLMSWISGSWQYRDYVYRASRAASITVGSSANPATVGTSVTFTAVVSGALGPPTGTFLFKDGTATLNGCSAAVISAGHADCTVAGLGVGTHPITALYSGDTTYQPLTSSSLPQAITAATPSITVGSSANPSTAGASVTFTAVVSGSVGPPTGTFLFKDGSTTISGCSAAVISAGQATCTVTGLAVGTHPITAAYSGDSVYSSLTSSTLPQSITSPPPPATPSITLGSSANPARVDMSVTFTAVVSGSAGTPTGTFLFQDGSATLSGCSAVVISAGQASCTATGLTVGTHSITATYSGNSAYASLSSSTLPQSMTSPLTPSITVGSSANPATAGTSVTFTAVISGSGGTPTGTFRFQDGSATLSGCSAVVISSGSASCTVTGLTGGTHPITAVYSGDSTYSSLTSSTLPQSMTLATPSITVGSSANPAPVGSSVTFTAVISGSSGAPTGTFLFKDGSTTLSGCSAAVIAAGRATCTATGLTAGNHPITAVYSGDGIYSSLTSSTLPETISP